MKIMMHMQTQKNKKSHKKIIAITAAATITVAAAFTIIFFRFMAKPQVKLVTALAKTLQSEAASPMNERYGFWNIFCSMKDDMNISYDRDDKGILIERGTESHEFLMEMGEDDRYKLYVNEKTSLIYVDKMAMRINYADNLITTMSNSPVVAITGLDSDAVYELGQAYERCMRFAADSYTDDDGQNPDVVDETVSYFMDMESHREGKKDIEAGERTERCELYSITFDVDDFNNYLDECFGAHSIDTKPLYDMVSRYVPETGAARSVQDMLSRINQLADDMEEGGSFKIYFAVNDEDELVTLYADDISGSSIDVSLTFEGEEYIAQSWELAIESGDGRRFVFDKRDIVEEDVCGTSVNAVYGSGGDDIELGAELSFEGDTVHVSASAGDVDISGTALVTGYEKGSFMDMEWTDGASGGIHIGCDAGDIAKPAYGDSIDILEEDLVSVYIFMKKLGR